MNDVRNRIKDNVRMERGDLSEITTKLQHQVSDLVERVTGIKQIKRQYLTIGLTVGLALGFVIGVLVGMLMHSVTEGTEVEIR